MKTKIVKSYLKRIIVLLFILTVSVFNPIYSQKALILGIHPYLPHTELKQRFAPLAKYLSKEIGQEIIIKIGTNYDEHIKKIGENQIDIAFLGPVSYVELVKKYGKKPLLTTTETNGTKYFQGKIVVRTENTIKSISELNVENFAFVSQKSTMGYILPIYMLYKAGHKDLIANKQVFLWSHKNVALGVLCGDYVAGAVKEEVFDSYQKSGLKVLATTPKIPEHLFVASSNLPSKTVAKLQNALIKLNNTENGKQIMISIKKTMTAMSFAEDGSYNELREILSFLEKARIKK